MIKVLCTRRIPEALISRAAEKNIDLVVKEFITVVPHVGPKDQDSIKDLLNLPDAVVVFTSKHAVNIVADYIRDTLPDSPPPHWKIYCLSEVTAATVRQRFPDSIVREKGSYARELAELLIRQEKKVKEVFFFCGNIRRDTLPDALHKKGIPLNEFVVYQTELTPHKLPEDYEGIVFFSPSAVKSFFSVNNITGTIPCFTIGNTTADAVRRYTRNEIIVSPGQDAETMIETVINSFQTRQQCVK